MKCFRVYQTKDGVATIVFESIIDSKMIEQMVLLYYTMYVTSDTESQYYFNIISTKKTESQVVTYQLA